VGEFSYKAVNDRGAHISGIIEAPDRRSAVSGLAEKGQYVIELTESAETSAISSTQELFLSAKRFFRLGSYHITGRDILAMTSQLSTALRAGLPLLNGLEIIREQQHKPAMKEMVGELAGSVKGGNSLSEAMSERKDIFSRLYISMVKVGETGGILDQTTSQLARILERDEKVKRNMKNASAYPAFVLTIGIISSVVVITWILPTVLKTIGTGVASLPIATQILLVISTFLKGYGWLVLILLVAGAYLFGRWAKGNGRVKWDTFKLKVPVLGSVLKTIAVGRFTRTLGALTRGGVTILEALLVVRDTLGNEFLGREIDEVTEKVKTGSSLAEPLGSSGNFPPLLIQIVSIGEQTGKLDELLLNAAETFDSDADSAITRFMAVFPAVLILILALVIGFIIAATLLPIIMMEVGGAGF